MKPIVVHHRHGLRRVDARRRAEAIAHRLQDEHGGSFEWDGDTLHFKRTGIAGEVTVTDEDVEVRVDVGVLLLPFRARIEREIRAFFDGDLGTSPPHQAARPTGPRSALTRSSPSPGEPKRRRRN